MNRAKPAALSLILVALGCGTSCDGNSDGNSDGNNELPDAGDAPAFDAAPSSVILPTWRLEDIQPDSPRFGQTYGLDTFANQVIVVVLVEGF